ncbi:ATP synthase subunit C [candidate division KSB1 bacterium]|nr:ATP synthase subunit C [candidate division KSB1 bacterium]
MEWAKILGYMGPAMALSLSAIGSSLGCYVATAASHGAMENEKVDPSVHGKLIALSAFPSSQTIYGIVLMFLLINKVATPEIISWGIGFSVFSLGLFGGVSIGTSAFMQGKACATAIKATAKNPSVFGKTAAGPGMIESYAIFTMVFCIVASMLIA